MLYTPLRAPSLKDRIKIGNVYSFDCGVVGCLNPIGLRTRDLKSPGLFRVAGCRGFGAKRFRCRV